MVRESNPPLYYTLLAGWMRLFGTGDFAIQCLSILIGLVGIVAAWLLARRMGGRGAGLIAAGLLSVSAAHLDFSQEVRGYILAHTAVLWACIGIVAYLERPRLCPLAGFAIGALVAVYSHTTLVVFVVLANVAVLWMLRGNWRALVPWLAANGAILLLWAWWGWISLKQLGGVSGFDWIARPDVADALEMTAMVYSPLYLASEQIAAPWLLGLIWLAGLGWFAAKDGRPPVLMLASLAIGCPILLWAISQKVPIFLPRTLFWAAGPAVILIALALAAVRGSPVRFALVAMILVLEASAVVRWLPMRESEAWPQAMEAVSDAGGDAVLLVEGDPIAVAVQHYLPGTGIRLLVLPPRRKADPWAEALVGMSRIDAAEVRRLLMQRGEIFTLRRGDYDPASVLRTIAVEYPLPMATRKRQPQLSLWRAKPAQ